MKDYKDIHPKPEGVEYTYKLIKGGDGHTYVSVQPIMADIKKSIEIMMDMDVSHLSEENGRIFELKILGLRTVYEFMGAIDMEQKLKDKAAFINGTTAINIDSVYKPYPNYESKNDKH